MPPRKKAKLAASGPATALSVATQDAVPEFQTTTLALLESIYDLRHCTSSTIHTEVRGLLKPSDGQMPWPICHGGTFKEIAQRAWSDPEQLLKMSAEFAHLSGFLDSPDPAEFAQEFCKVDATWTISPFGREMRCGRQRKEKALKLQCSLSPSLTKRSGVVVRWECQR